MGRCWESLAKRSRYFAASPQFVACNSTCKWEKWDLSSHYYACIITIIRAKLGGNIVITTHLVRGYNLSPMYYFIPFTPMKSPWNPRNHHYLSMENHLLNRSLDGNFHGKIPWKPPYHNQKNAEWCLCSYTYTVWTTCTCIIMHTCMGTNIRNLQPIFSPTWTPCFSAIRRT